MFRLATELDKTRQKKTEFSTSLDLTRAHEAQLRDQILLERVIKT